jgi:hypothetical protein
MSMGVLVMASGLRSATSSMFTPPSEEAISTGPCTQTSLACLLAFSSLPSDTGTVIHPQYK